MNSYKANTYRKDALPWLEFAKLNLDVLLKILAVVAGIYIIKTGRLELLIGGA